MRTWGSPSTGTISAVMPAATAPACWRTRRSHVTTTCRGAWAGGVTGRRSGGCHGDTISTDAAHVHGAVSGHRPQRLQRHFLLSDDTLGAEPGAAGAGLRRHRADPPGRAAAARLVAARADGT